MFLDPLCVVVIQCQIGFRSKWSPKTSHWSSNFNEDVIFAREWLVMTAPFINMCVCVCLFIKTQTIWLQNHRLLTPPPFSSLLINDNNKVLTRLIFHVANFLHPTSTDNVPSNRNRLIITGSEQKILNNPLFYDDFFVNIDKKFLFTQIDMTCKLRFVILIIPITVVCVFMKLSRYCWWWFFLGGSFMWTISAVFLRNEN